MLRSEARALVAVAASAVVAACAQATGLSDDYRFDRVLDAGAADVAPAPDASSSGGPICTASDRDAAEGAIDRAGSTDEPGADCRSCLGSECCAEVERCAGDPACFDAMTCVFACGTKTGNAKNECIDRCATGFTAIVGACATDACGSRCPAIQPL